MIVANAQHPQSGHRAERFTLDAADFVVVQLKFDQPVQASQRIRRDFSDKITGQVQYF